jgi:hypothetical protein
LSRRETPRVRRLNPHYPRNRRFRIVFPVFLRCFFLATFFFLYIRCPLKGFTAILREGESGTSRSKGR